ncbi:lyase family protein [Phytomonospora sp. NPDC050363]|uniref:argininosuccinate lyase n=1 Tax=Phytomonospora sp. NPDC050363 TaxID=3155642 RepID=UPI0033D6681F
MNGTPVAGAATALSGRIGSGPARLLHDEVLAPQFRYESAHLLGWYALIEKILLCEYRRLGLVSAEDARSIAKLLSGLAEGVLEPDPDGNMSDPAFAIERHVEENLPGPVPAWHVDRSRNDLQATAQLMAARGWAAEAAGRLLDTARAAVGTAARLTDLPMPGYTQMQAAQVMSPGFHLAALADQLLASVERLLGTYDHVDRCPLGAGAMTGQELDFDRERMARLGGFAAPQPHALVSVASRSWALLLASDISVLGVTLSRFATDLMAWGGGDQGWLVLPDELSGISSAMPQKRNYPVLERIRGRTAHLSSAYLDVALAQRSTPFTNMVEVSKESTAGLLGMFGTLGSVLRLLDAVLSGLSIDAERARAACAGEFLGGFTLANHLTLHEGVPWRRAQVLAGRCVTAALERGLAPPDVGPGLLAEVAAAEGVTLADPAAALAKAFGGNGLSVKVTPGSTAPAAVSELLSELTRREALLRGAWRARSATVSAAVDRVDALLGVRRAAGGPA